MEIAVTLLEFLLIGDAEGGLDCLAEFELEVFADLYLEVLAELVF